MLTAGLLLLSSLQRTTVVVVPGLPLIAVCVSGATRGPASLRASVAALRAHLLVPARQMHGARISVFGWLQDSAAEQAFEEALRSEPVVITRRMVHHLLPPELALNEAAALRADHGRLIDSQRIGSRTPAARGVNLTNTLRMLRKIRGCEWLRQHQQSLSAQPHTLVVRVRPDLLLLEPLPLPLPLEPPPARSRAWGWHCAAQRVATDQLLVGAPSLATRLGELYLPDVLWAAMARSQPATAYPERLVWQHLRASGYELDPLPCRTALVSDGGGARSPHAKLARDFPSAECLYPTPYETQADLRLASERLLPSAVLDAARPQAGVRTSVAESVVAHRAVGTPLPYGWHLNPEY